MILKQCRRVGVERRVLQKNHKEQGWLLQNRIQRGGSWQFHKMRSMDSTGEKHIVLCTRFQYPAPNLSGSGIYKGAGLAPQILRSGAVLKPVPLQSSSATHALPPPIRLYFFHLVPIALTLG